MTTKLVGILVAVAVLGTACTAGADAVPYTVRLEQVSCPPEISVQTVLALTCSYVIVPLDRNRPDEASVRLFIIRLEPDARPAGPPVLYIGGEIATSLDYRNLVDVGLSLPSHELISVELRGTGHSEPNLSCPEVDALVGQTRAEPIADPKLRRAFIDAVASCRARIVADGVDPAAFDVSAMASDVLDVVGVLHLPEWEMLSKGSASRVAFEVMRAAPDGLQALALYGPEFPDTDPFVQAFESTRASFARLTKACRADAACGERFPDVEGDAKRAIDRLQAHPIVVRDAGEPVLMDGAALLRYLRAFMSVAGEADIGHFPATVAAIADGSNSTRLLTRLVGLDGSSQTYCTGYLPVCGSTLNQGVYYSVVCRDEAPFSDVGAISELARGNAAWASDYVENPYLDVCKAWDVPPADASVTEPISSDVPVYVDSGALSPFVMSSEVRRGIAGLSRVQIGISAVDGDVARFAVTGTCADLRELFLDHPTTSLDLGCYAQARLRFFPSPI